MFDEKCSMTWFQCLISAFLHGSASLGDGGSVFLSIQNAFYITKCHDFILVLSCSALSANDVKRSCRRSMITFVLKKMLQWTENYRAFMSRSTTKAIKWHVRPAKTQISLVIHPVWSYFAWRSLGSQGPKASSRCHFVGFVVLWLLLI